VLHSLYIAKVVSLASVLALRKYATIFLQVSIRLYDDSSDLNSFIASLYLQ
jgi:hypothetical protein